MRKSKFTQEQIIKVLQVVEFPEVGGLHYRFERTAA